MNQIHKKIMSILEGRRGKGKAITQGALAVKADVSPRYVRQNIEELIVDHQIIICASYDGRRGGYFLPLNQDEIDEYESILKSHGIKILQRLSVLKKKSLAETVAEFQTEINL